VLVPAQGFDTSTMNELAMEGWRVVAGGGAGGESGGGGFESGWVVMELQVD